MKSVLFNQITVVYFILILVTYFLIRRGRIDFATKQKTNFLRLAVVSTIASAIFLAYYSFAAGWWALICLLNLGAVFIIVADSIASGIYRSLMNSQKTVWFRSMLRREA